MEDRRLNGARPNGSKPPQGSRKEKLESYDYVDEDGALLFQVLRFGYRSSDGTLALNKSGKPDKTFHQRRPVGDEPKVWIWGLAAGDYMRKAPGQDWYRFDERRWNELPGSRERKTIAAAAKSVPYRLPALVEAVSLDQRVFIVEGEQKADVLAEWNICATCNAEGAGKWTVAHAGYLRGADVVILPDNDDRGREHAEAVAQSLQGIAARVRLGELTGLGPKGDVVDWIGAGGTREELDALVDHTTDWQPSTKTERPGPNGRGLVTYRASDIRIEPI
jgi:hypothetical protein